MKLSVVLAIALLASAFADGASAQLRGPAAWQALGERGIRGVTVGPIESSQQPGRGYGTPYTEELLDELVALGTTWVSITPFGRVWSLESTEILMDFEAPYEDNREAIGRFVEQAHARGLRVLLIPHLWVEMGGWRGEMNPGGGREWPAYQRAYRDFVMAWANDAARFGVDAFSVGVECKSWSARFGGYWDALIGEIRGVFPGLLTYSANWDEAEDVVFWDRLDFVGINAFYPLASHNEATFAEYVEGATRNRDAVRDLAILFDKPVLFVEVGYTTRSNAAVEPWLWPDDMQGVVIDQVEQARALRAVFGAFLGEPWFAGFFIWRYYANLDDVSQEAEWGFSPHGKLAERVLHEAFVSEWWGEGEPGFFAR